MNKLSLLAGFAAGYVLGAKAGTERYDQIMAKVDEVMGKPQVKKATDTLAQTASDLGDKAKTTVNDKVDSVTSSTAPTSGTSGTATSGAGTAGTSGTGTPGTPGTSGTTRAAGAAPSGAAPDVSMSTGTTGATTGSH